MRFLKVVVSAKAGTTDIVNILYYGNGVNLPTDYTASDMQDLGKAVRDAFDTSYTTEMATGYKVDVITVSQVNEENQATGAFTVQVAGGAAVGNQGDCDGRAPALPVSFIMDRVVDLNPLRVPKRSYVAVGPIASQHINNDGDYIAPQIVKDKITAVLEQGHLINALVFEPYRVGVVNADGLPAVGRVIGVRMARRITARRSRLDR